jgi:hypothetical protein
MSKLRVGAWGLLLLFVAPFLFSAEMQKSANFSYHFDVDSATSTYVRMAGQNGDPFGGSIAGPGTVKTVAGPTTAVVENVVGSNPFRDVGVGDVIVVSRTTNARDVVVVTAKASDAAITVDPAVTWDAGFAWRWWDSQSGTTVNDGWISVGSGSLIGVTVQYEQGDLDALKVRFECRGDWLGAQPVVLYPGESSDCGPGGTLAAGFCEFATPGITARFSITDTAPIYSSCRVSLSFKTTDVSDVGANLERIVAAVTVGSFR